MKAEEFDKRQEAEPKREYKKIFLFSIALLFLVFVIVWSLLNPKDIVDETILIDGIGGYDKLEVCRNETIGTFIVGESCSPKDFEEVSCVLYNDSVVSMGVYNLTRWSKSSNYDIFSGRFSNIIVDYKILAVLDDCDSNPKIDFFYMDKHGVIVNTVNSSLSDYFKVGGCDIRVEFFTIISSCIEKNTTIKSFNVCKPVYENITKQVCKEGKNCNERYLNDYSLLIGCLESEAHKLGLKYCFADELVFEVTKTVCEE